MSPAWAGQAVIGVFVQIARDVRHAVRRLPKTAGLAAVVIVSIAIGIGVNATVFSWIQSNLLSPIAGVRASSRVLLLEPRGESGMYPGTSWLEFRDLRSRLTSFDDLLAFRMVPFTVGATELPERATGMLISDNYFQALELKPARGRFPSGGDRGSAVPEPVVIVSHDYWQTRLAAADVIGQPLRVNDRPLTIVAIAPPDFQGTLMGLKFDLWVPATMAPVLFEGSQELENRGQRGYTAMGMLAAGVSRAQAQRDVDGVMRQFAQEFPDTNATFRGEVLALGQSPRGPQRFLSTALVMLQGAMLLVLLAVCANTANLVLARASGRELEVSARMALGAGRWRIVSLLLTESVLWSLAGAALGVLFAMWGTEALRAVPLPSPGGMSLRFQTGVDWITLGFAAALGVGCGVAFGLPPALHLARLGPRAALRAPAGAPARSRLREVVMLVEVALAVVVLAVAALFLRSFAETQSTDPGFRRDGVMLATYDMRGRARTVTATASANFAARLLERLRAVPAIDAVAIASNVPLDIHGLPTRSFTLEGHARSDGLPDSALSNTVTPGYFAALEIPILAGRDFVELGDSATAPEAIVNAEFVRRFCDGQAPLGRAIESAGRRYIIVGVVRNSLYNAFGEAPTPFIYLSYRDRPSSIGEVHARTRTGDATAVVADVRRAVRDLDPTLPVYNLRTFNDHVDANLVFRRIPARIFAALVPVLLALTAVGIYAVVAYAVARRRAEIGVRIALGASGPQVVRQFVRETLRVVVLGCVAGWIVAAMIAADTVGGTQRGLLQLALVPAVMIAVAAIASWIPAWRGARVDPMSALRTT